MTSVWGERTKTCEYRGLCGQKDSRKRTELSSSESFLRGMRCRRESM